MVQYGLQQMKGLHGLPFHDPLIALVRPKEECDIRPMAEAFKGFGTFNKMNSTNVLEAGCGDMEEDTMHGPLMGQTSAVLLGAQRDSFLCEREEICGGIR